MNKWYIFGGILLLVLTLGVSIFIFKYLTQTPNQSAPSITTSTGITTFVVPGAVISPEVGKAFVEQISNPNELKLGKTVTAANYALQTWGDENKGGEALLVYSAAKGWELVSMGGGAWDVESLIAVGVPSSVAEQLIAKSQ